MYNIVYRGNNNVFRLYRYARAYSEYFNQSRGSRKIWPLSDMNWGTKYYYFYYGPLTGKGGEWPTTPRVHSVIPVAVDLSTSYVLHVCVYIYLLFTELPPTEYFLPIPITTCRGVEVFVTCRKQNNFVLKATNKFYRTNAEWSDQYIQVVGTYQHILCTKHRLWQLEYRGIELY